MIPKGHTAVLQRGLSLGWTGPCFWGGSLRQTGLPPNSSRVLVFLRCQHGNSRSPPASPPLSTHPGRQLSFIFLNHEFLDIFPWRVSRNEGGDARDFHTPPSQERKVLPGWVSQPASASPASPRAGCGHLPKPQRAPWCWWNADWCSLCVLDLPPKIKNRL